MKRRGLALIVDDEPNMRRVLAALLKKHGFASIDAADGEAALELLAENEVDVVVSDLKMPRMNGLELLEQARRRFPDVPLILITAHGTVGSAVEALKQGALDYLTKPFDPDEIGQVLEKALLARESQHRESRIGVDADPDQLLVGNSEALAEIIRVTDRVADTPATILVSGESGTGKERVARRVHLRSERSQGPFIKVNCAAIPDGLLESELFGHERGAFTGAASQKPGRFELADGGSLFLDEIGEMPLAAQPKLLRALQENRFYRVGGTETVTVDTRIIAATNRDLREEVAQGRFREDLFYRLNVVPVRMPALRERCDDIPLLVDRFAERISDRMDRERVKISEAALAILQRWPWPGNIRELDNAIERAVLLCDGNEVAAEDLPLEYREHTGPAPEAGASDGLLKDRVRQATRKIEHDAIAAALEVTGGNVTQAAKRLGLSRRGLQLKMKELGIRSGC